MIKNKEEKINIWVLIILLIIFVGLVILVQSGVLYNFELNFYEMIKKFESNFLTNFFKLITFFGGKKGCLLIVVILFLVSKTTRRELSVQAGFTVGFSALFNLILKNIFRRIRPDVFSLIIETGFSFPSGHSIGASSLYFTIILFLIRNVENKLLRDILSTLLFLLIFLIGLSRIYLGVHYLGDVLVGWTLGFLFSYLIDYGFKKYDLNNFAWKIYDNVVEKIIKR